ncbi:hypothetical protein Fcan01_25394 [Folsomia candida]|uniref:Uncharacterized protein n=1 Tax=Folsomia candida TaxID=158441 RepID=A0A226D5M7_FOLCA|nr:hypothetical protein Fcan01_25394 [Folsomia candida]
MEKSLMTTPTGGVVSKFQMFNLDLPIELRRMICRMPYMSWVFAEAPMATPLCRHEVYDKGCGQITAGYDDLTIRQESVPRSFEFPCRILKFNTAMSFDFFDLVTSITALMGATSIALYLSISAYTLIPVSVYWMFPTLSVIGVCFLEVLLIPFIYMSEESTVIIQRLKILPATMPQFVATQRFDHRKLGRKRIRTMRPFVVYADYTTQIFGLKPNTVEWLTFEKKLHNIPGDARKKMNRLTGLAGNSTIMSPEFSCSNSDDSETRVEEYLNLVGEN